VIARANCWRRRGHEWKRIAEDGGSVIGRSKNSVLNVRMEDTGSH
jgi:hypothetical protein